MEKYRKIAAVLLLAATAAGTVALSVFLTRWVIMSSQMEKEELFNRLDFKIKQAVNETQDEIRILFPLLTGNISKADIRSAYKIWESNSEYKQLIKSIIYVKSVVKKELITYYPDTDTYGIFLKDESLQMLLDPGNNTKDKYIEIINKLDDSGYILMPVFKGDSEDSASIMPEQLFIIAVNQDVLLGKLLKNRIESNLPNSKYRIYVAGKDTIVAENTDGSEAEPDLVLSLRGNMFQFGAIPEYSWAIRESRLLSPDLVSVFSDKGIISAVRRQHTEKSILVNFYLSENPYLKQISVRKTVSLILGNSALILIWGSLFVLTLLYGRSRRLRKQEQEFVRSIINGMPEHLKEVLVLCYYHRFAYKEIAEIVGIPLGTVKSRLHTAVSYFGRAYQAAVKERV